MNTSTRMKKLSPTTRSTISALVNVMQSPTGLTAAGTQVQKALENICIEIGVDKATPEKLLPLTVERAVFDETRVYEDKISSLLSQVAAICDAYRIPFLFAAHVSRSDDGTEEGGTTFDLLHSELNVLNPIFDVKFLEAFESLTQGKRSPHDLMCQTVASPGGLDLSVLFGGPRPSDMSGYSAPMTAGDGCAAQRTAAPAPAPQASHPAPEPRPEFGAHSGPATRPSHLRRPAPLPKAPARAHGVNGNNILFGSGQMGAAAKTAADIKSNSRPAKTPAKPATVTFPAHKRKYTRRS